MLIEVKVKTTRLIEGKTRKKTETYILDREFFAEAEYTISAELMEEQNSHLLENFEIIALRQSPIKEIATQFSGQQTYIATLRDIWLETDGTEKYLRYKVLLWADNLTQANTHTQQLSRQGYDMLIEGLKQVDYIYLQNESTNEESEQS